MNINIKLIYVTKSVFIEHLIFFGAIGIVVETAIDYRRDCKKYGVLKATIWLVIIVLITALVVYNKDAKLFR